MAMITKVAKLNKIDINKYFDMSKAKIMPPAPNYAMVINLPYVGGKAPKAADLQKVSDLFTLADRSRFSENQVKFKGKDFLIGDGDDSYAYKPAKDGKSANVWVRTFSD